MKFKLYERKNSMTKNHFIKKISSRKFWICLCGFVSSIMALYNFSDDTATRVISIIAGAGCLVTYMFAEGYADGKCAESRKTSENNAE